MKHALTLLCSLLMLGAGHAQVGKMFTTDNELSSSLVNEIIQDRNGMIWVATESGLNRYNGSKFATYKHDDADPGSLCHNLVRSVFEDSRGHLLVGTYAGLQLYDPATDRFSRPAVNEAGDPFAGSINHFSERRNGDVLVLGEGLFTVDLSDSLPVLRPFVLPDSVVLNDGTCLLEDDRLNLWIGGHRSIRCLTAAGELKSYREENQDFLVSDIVQDNRGNLYAGTMGGGLLRYDPETDAFVRIPFNGRCNLPVKDLYVASADEIYVGTDGEGMKIYHTRTGQFVDYTLINRQLPPPHRGGENPLHAQGRRGQLLGGGLSARRERHSSDSQ